MSDHDLGLAELSREELEARLSRAMYALGAMQRLRFALKELVPKAFEEGFRRRLPETEEPWLIDWLQSDTKRALEPLLSGARRLEPQPEPQPEPQKDAD